jgi:hypothetical protein
MSGHITQAQVRHIPVGAVRRADQHPARRHVPHLWVKRH